METWCVTDVLRKYATAHPTITHRQQNCILSKSRNSQDPLYPGQVWTKRLHGNTLLVLPCKLAKGQEVLVIYMMISLSSLYQLCHWHEIAKAYGDYQKVKFKSRALKVKFPREERVVFNKKYIHHQQPNCHRVSSLTPRKWTKKHIGKR